MQFLVLALQLWPLLCNSGLGNTILASANAYLKSEMIRNEDMDSKAQVWPQAKTLPGVQLLLQGC